MITANQQRQWSNYVKMVDACQLQIDALLQIYPNVIAIDRIATKYGIDVGAKSFNQKISSASKEQQRVQRCVAAVISGKLGVRFSGNDFDIMAPPEMTAEERSQYESLGIIVEILLGAVVIAAASSAIYSAYMAYDSYGKEFQTIEDVAEKRFCEDPQSPMCSEWKQIQDSEVFQKNAIDADGLWSEAKKIAGSIGTGTKIGLLIAIPLLVWAVFGRR